jgi:hypothetical protein
MLSLPEADGGGLAAQVLWVDRFGNLQLNVGPDDIDQLEADAERVRIAFADDTRVARRVAAFADLDRAELGLVLDSYGLLALSLDQRSAAEELGLAAGDGVTLEPLAAGDGGGSGVTTAVELGPRTR